MKLKDTLHLGKTSFDMRANLPSKEVSLQKEWQEADLYHKIQKKNAKCEPWILHDGPPYANGRVHMGHAFNKISKDFITRYKSMSGYYSPYVPGWDTHGLPIESALQKNEGVNRKEHSTAEFRKLCEAYALKQVEGQKETFMRLGVNGDWENPYLTLNPEYEAQQLRIFGQMADKGYIYKGAKPVYWSWSSESSLAEAEVEYQDVTSPSIYVAFKVKNGGNIVPQEAEFVIWTTTPWTLPANLGISVLGEASYVQVAVADRHFIVAEDLLESVASTLEWNDYQVEAHYKGQDFDRLTAQHPFYDRESLLMVGDHVTLETGTGLVHTAPGHGEDDYWIGLEYGLDILSPVDGKGHFTDEAPGLEGVFYLKGQKQIVEKLKENQSLLHYSEFVHSYPHDWRTKKPVIYRATPQWFASIEKFRSELLENVENAVTWHHPSGKRRIYNMIRDRGDWVISRQRVWGVPLPIFYAENGEAILELDLVNHVADLVEKHGTNIWFEWEAEDLLPEGYQHSASPNGKFTKEMDIMDVWFDSGTSYAGVLQAREDLTFPADLYLEGSDQYRGWFNSSFTTSVAVNGFPPYKAVLSQGFVNDGKGQKMSKSLGNVIDPADIMNNLGADIIRLWVASVDYESDVRVSDEILKQVSESYRKIRNTIRFMLGLVNDYNPEENAVANDQLTSLDQYMAANFNLFKADVLDAYDHYQFPELYKRIMNFVSSDLSAFYLNIAKDIVYIEAKESYARRSMQTVIYRMVHDLLLLMTPLIVHTTEEAWKDLPGVDGFIQLAEMPKAEKLEVSKAIASKWEVFFKLQTGVNKALEEAKNHPETPIKKSFEAAVSLYISENDKKAFDLLSEQPAQLFTVSQLSVLPYTQAPADALRFEDYAVKVDFAEGQICDRCRAVRPEVGTIEGAEELCHRCYEIVRTEYPEYFENKD
ncbi:isoleucine--tRNA ligase [Facklamia miroungae]|uniref:Isoleucine--tRNA ligase n=1 Tax=Facklamia miroungae TaxID=120956 RepID=A0A1G7TUL1_9LACT|nr:isoleucine--tRNA ligase [Facklamia miroungae]NKZ29976.1 isoleucine--tRNA ligase [Facklamia miroungae]SDG38933.1 isoleucyl-tRNA synthetase [Facklamia miroungae]